MLCFARVSCSLHRPCRVPFLAPSQRGWTVFHLAALKGHVAAMKLLAAMGADLNAADLAISLKLNGEQRQASRTGKMIFDVPEIIHQLSSGFTLLPGDVIMTGTPEGVGYAMQPPQTMKAGDVMELTIEGIGTLTNTVSD